MAAMSLRIPDELAVQLRAAADEEGRSMNAAVVTAIDEWLDRRRADHVSAVVESVAERHARLLDRLGKA